MPQETETQVLLLGATGYIGGSVLAELLKSESKLKHGVCIFSALVRKPDQVKTLKDVGVNGILFKSLDDFDTIRDTAKNHDIVIGAASARHKGAAKAIMEGLALRRESTGNEVHYIHTSGASMVGDWPETGGRVDLTIHSDIKEDIYSLEKNFPESLSPVRTVDLFVVEFGEAKGVNTYIVIPPLIFGRGTGLFTEGVGQVHMMVQLALKKKQSVIIGSGLGNWSRVHILDLAHIYSHLMTAILSKSKPPSGKSGYYFAENGLQSWKSIGEGIGKVGKESGVFNTSDVGNIDLQEVADVFYEGNLTDAEGVMASNSKIQADRARKILKWKPQFGETAFDAEIGEVVGIMVKEQNTTN